MPAPLIPILVVAGGRMLHEHMKRRRLDQSLTCRMCGGRMSAPYKQTTCCKQPLCSDRCVRGYVAASSDGCIYHS